MSYSQISVCIFAVVKGAASGKCTARILDLKMINFDQSDGQISKVYFMLLFLHCAILPC